MEMGRSAAWGTGRGMRTGRGRDAPDGTAGSRKRESVFGVRAKEWMQVQLKE
jgi:ribosomal protein L15